MATNRSDHSDNPFEEWGNNNASEEQGYTPAESVDEWGISSAESAKQAEHDTPPEAWSAVSDSSSNGEYSNAQYTNAEYTEQPQQSQQPQQPQQPYRPEPYVPGPEMGPAPSPNNDNRGLTIAVIVLAIIAVALLVGAMAFFYFSNSKGSSTAGNSASSQVKSASSENSPASSTAQRRAQNFQPPASWRHCSGSGNPGDLNLVYAEDVGGNITSCPFATNVRNAFVEHYRMTNKLDGTITANSPTTGKTYTMTCRDDGEVVTCTGGTNATVHIV